MTFNTTAGTYSYDGDGRRVKKTDMTGTTVFVYNAGGQLIAEYTSVDPVSTNGLSYLTSDHLGSTRLVTDINGYVKARHDYLPFGEELPSSVGSRSSVDGYGAVDGVRQKFTQKERDVESGLDYYGARYYSSAQGRFSSCDPLPVTKESFVNPQRWNMFIYVKNNPVAAFDPNGADGQGKSGDKVISIFLEFQDADRNFLTQPSGKQTSDAAPNWTQTAVLGAFSGYGVEFFGNASTGMKGLPMLGSANDFEYANSSSEVVLYIGHGRGFPVNGANSPFAQNSIHVDPLHNYGRIGAFMDPVPLASDSSVSEYTVWGGRPQSSAAVFGSFNMWICRCAKLSHW